MSFRENRMTLPTASFIGLANTALAPVGIIGPLLVAQLAAILGYSVLFATTHHPYCPM
jgi:hypothetical protein